MAKKTFPSDVLIPHTEVRLVQSHPGQSVFPIADTGAERIIEFADGFWTGTLVFVPQKGANARKAEAFFSSLKRSMHWFDLPINNYKPVSASNFTAVTIDSDFKVNTNRNIADAELGTYVNNGNRLYIIDEKLANRQIRLWPEVRVANNSVFTPATYLRIKRADGDIELPNTPSYFGPWEFQFKEYISP